MISYIDIILACVGTLIYDTRETTYILLGVPLLVIFNNSNDLFQKSQSICSWWYDRSKRVLVEHLIVEAVLRNGVFEDI